MRTAETEDEPRYLAILARANAAEAALAIQTKRAEVAEIETEDACDAAEEALEQTEAFKAQLEKSVALSKEVLLQRDAALARVATLEAALKSVLALENDLIYGAYGDETEEKQQPGAKVDRRTFAKARAALSEKEKR